MILKDLLVEDKNKEFTIDIDGEEVHAKSCVLLKVLMNKYLQQKVISITDNLFDGTKITIEKPLSKKQAKEKQMKIANSSFKIPCNWFVSSEAILIEMDDKEKEQFYSDEDI